MTNTREIIYLASNVATIANPALLPLSLALHGAMMAYEAHAYQQADHDLFLDKLRAENGKINALRDGLNMLLITVASQLPVINSIQLVITLIGQLVNHFITQSVGQRHHSDVISQLYDDFSEDPEISEFISCDDEEMEYDHIKPAQAG